MAKLSHQQRALVKNLIKGMTITDAALAAGYSEKCPGQAGHQALEAIKRKMPDILDNHGLTDETLIEKYLKPALEATETEFAKFEGKITDQCEVVAWSPRLTALDMAFNLKGNYAPKDDNRPELNVGVKVVIEHIGNQDTITATAIGPAPTVER